MMSPARGGSLAAAALLSACASLPANYVEMNVQAFSDPEHRIESGASFATVVLGVAKNELLEKELLYLVKERLVARGFVYDESDPDFFVGATGFIGSFEEYVPPSTVYFPLPGSTTTTTTGAVGGVPFGATSSTTGTQYMPITRPGYNQTQYYRVIDVIVAEPIEQGGQLSVRALWRGRADSNGNTGDLLIVAPVMLDELLSEFPQRTGRDPRRVVGWQPPPKQ